MANRRKPLMLLILDGSGLRMDRSQGASAVSWPAAGYPGRAAAGGNNGFLVDR